MEGDLQIKLAEVFCRLSSKELKRILLHMVKTNEPVPHNLYLKLTREEAQLVLREDSYERH